jgi:hypothetical protein
MKLFSVKWCFDPPNECGNEVKRYAIIKKHAIPIHNIIPNVTIKFNGQVMKSVIHS